MRPHHTPGQRNTKPPESLPVASLGISISDSLQIGPIVMSEERLCSAAEAKKLSKAKIQLKILCNARSEAFGFLGLSALMLRCQPVARNLSRTCPRTCHKFSGGVEIGRRARFRIAKSSISKHRFSFQKTIDLREKNAIFHDRRRVYDRRVKTS